MLEQKNWSWPDLSPPALTPIQWMRRVCEKCARTRKWSVFSFFCSASSNGDRDRGDDQLHEGRKIFGGSVLDNHVVHYRLAELQTEIEALRSMLYRAVGRFSCKWNKMIKQLFNKAFVITFLFCWFPTKKFVKYVKRENLLTINFGWDLTYFEHFDVL